MDEPPPLQGNDQTLISARQRIIERFQCSEEEATARLMASIQGLFNGPDAELPPQPPENPPIPQDVPPVPPRVPSREPSAPPLEQPVTHTPVLGEIPRVTINKKPAYIDFVDESQVSSRVPHTPSEYAVGKIEGLEYVELWYFTPEGCDEAGTATPSVANDALGFLATATGIALQPIKATKASKNAVIDECLTWEQIMTARHTLITTANRVGWDNRLTFALAQLYIKLESFKAIGYDPQALIVYHAVVRRLWHDGLKGRGNSFNISNFNEGLFDKLEYKIRNRELAEMKKKSEEFEKQVSNPKPRCPKPTAKQEYLFSPNPPPPLPKTRHHSSQRNATLPPLATPITRNAVVPIIPAATNIVGRGIPQGTNRDTGWL